MATLETFLQINAFARGGPQSRARLFSLLASPTLFRIFLSRRTPSHRHLLPSPQQTPRPPRAPLLYHRHNGCWCTGRLGGKQWPARIPRSAINRRRSIACRPLLTLVHLFGASLPKGRCFPANRSSSYSCPSSDDFRAVMLLARCLSACRFKT